MSNGTGYIALSRYARNDRTVTAGQVVHIPRRDRARFMLNAGWIRPLTEEEQSAQSTAVPDSVVRVVETPPRKAQPKRKS
jgi:hypothetical protein